MDYTCDRSCKGGDCTMKLLKVEEVAEMLDCSEYRVYTLAREGIIPSVRLGRQLRFSADALNEFIATGGKGFDGPGGWRKEA